MAGHRPSDTASVYMPMPPEAVPARADVALDFRKSERDRPPARGLPFVGRLLLKEVRMPAKRSSPSRATSKSGGRKRGGNRCWSGYEPTPGKKPGAKGSCRKK